MKMLCFYFLVTVALMFIFTELEYLQVFPVIETFK
jgi:hypothetical protein